MRTAKQQADIWTIGHSTRTIEEFIALLHLQGIRLLADVRRFPGSRRHPQFAREELMRWLAGRGFEYIWMGEAFTPHAAIETREYVRETQLHRDPGEADPLRHGGGGDYLFGDGHALWNASWHKVDYMKLGLPWEAAD